MKKNLVTILLVAVLLIGLSAMLYPIVSDYINSLTQSRIIARFNEELLTLDDTEYSQLLDAARKYNAGLLTKNNRFTMSEAELREYLTLLDFNGTGIIGVLEIEAIKVKLPLYLSTGHSILQIGVGHFEGSSLPIGGPGTHSVISGHRGLPSSTLLTNLDKLVIGDTFTVKALKDTLVYEIDQIEVAEPGDMNFLKIDRDEDYCTLLTCTPYGVNSHRLLVRGHRIFTENNGETAPPNSRNVGSAIMIIFSLVAASMCKLIMTLLRKKAPKKKGGLVYA